MKNFITSILCILIAFFGTYFALKNTIKSSEKSEIALKNISDNSEETNNSVSNTMDYSDILSSYDNWKNYNNENIDLSSEFIAVDIDGSEIDKKNFLEKLLTGSYIPVKLFESENMYQLHKLKAEADEKISKSIKRNSNSIYNYFLKEGSEFPQFNFTDLNGNNYTSNNTKGKYLIIQCGFAQCTQCIDEFPKLNELYDKYEDFEDVVFISLSFDKEDKLKKILSNKEFRYPVIPNQKSFIKDKINATQYPTHIIVDKYGNIEKIITNSDSLTLTIDNLLNGNLMEQEMI